MKSNEQTGFLSIGGLAKASGVSVETLRNWERRYGFPSPERRDSGHRRYQWDIVERLTKIHRVLELGYKPSFAVNAGMQELDQILGQEFGGVESSGMERLETGEGGEIALWLERVRQMDAHGLTVFFRKAWVRVGARRFINRMVIPCLQEVGNRWEDGRFTVAHEHFCSEVLQTFLSSHWRPLASRARNGKVVLANLEGEFHSLRLHLAAVYLVLHDFEPIFLGPNTPAEDILSAAREMSVHSLVIGLAPSSDLDRAQEEMERILNQVSNDVFLIFGGNEHLHPSGAAQYMETFELFDEWCRVQAGPG